MKHLKIIFLSFFFIAFYSPLMSQQIGYMQNDMTDEIYYMFFDSNGKSGLLVSEDGVEGLRLRVFFREGGQTKLLDNITPQTIFAEMIVQGINCVEDGFLIIRFENGERIRISNSKGFCCDASFYFNILPSYLDLLLSERIDMIMIRDGRSHRSYTHTPDNPDFFVELGQALKRPFVRIE